MRKQTLIKDFPKLFKFLEKDGMNEYSSLSVYSNSKYNWQCSHCSDTFSSSPRYVYNTQLVLCDICRVYAKAAKKYSMNKNKLINTHPKIAEQFIKFTHETVNEFLNVKHLTWGNIYEAEFQCQCGKTLVFSLNSRNKPKENIFRCQDCFYRAKFTKRANKSSDKLLINEYPELYKAATRIISNTYLNLPQVSSHSRVILEWKCQCETTFLSTPASRVEAGNTFCQQCRRNGKSFFEFEIKAILELLLNTKIEMHYSRNNTAPVDLYVEKFDVALQLDPYWSHKNKQKVDERIYKEHSKVYTKIVRLREEGLLPIADSISVLSANDRKSYATPWYEAILNSSIFDQLLPLSKNQLEDARSTATREWNKTFLEIKDNLTTKPYFKEYVKNISHPGRKPQLISQGSGDMCLWRCSKGHEWKATVGDRKSGRNCGKCYRINHTRVNAEESLAYLYPDVAKQFVRNVTSPELGIWNVKPTRHDLALWKCKDCHKYLVVGINSKIRHQVNANRGVHGHVKQAYADDSLLTDEEKNHINAIRQKEHELWLGKQPKEIPNNLTTKPYYAEFVKNITNPGKDPKLTPGFASDVCLWRCVNGHEWETKIAYRRGRNCNQCRLEREKAAREAKAKSQHCSRECSG